MSTVFATVAFWMDHMVLGIFFCYLGHIELLYDGSVTTTTMTTIVLEKKSKITLSWDVS